MVDIRTGPMMWRDIERAYERQDWVAMARHAHALARLDPKQPGALFAMATVAYWCHGLKALPNPFMPLWRAYRMITVAAQQAELFPILHNAAAVQRLFDGHASALLYALRAVEQEPDNPAALAEVGGLLHALGAHDEAREAFDRALRSPRTLPEDGLQQSASAFMLGDFARGWQMQEHRWDNPNLNLLGKVPDDTVRWDGTPCDGLVLIVEQGAGDILQCLRFLPWALERAGRVWFVGRPEFRRLIETHWPSVTFAVPSEPWPAGVKHYATVMSLPAMHGWPPPAEPYLPGADAGRLAAVALAWRGSPSHRNDRNRSMSVRDLAPLMGSGLTWYVFEGADELRRAYPEVAIVALTPADWEDSRRLLREVDAVVSVDTSLAHLGGAMGIPCHVLVAADCDSRWGMQETTTAWYPSWRIYRQPDAGDWTTPVTQLAEVLG